MNFIRRPNAILRSLILAILILGLNSTVLYADDGGDMGFFGGISEGSKLPYTMDKYVDSGVDEKTTFQYKEVVFISGEPVEFKGTITVEKDDEDIMDEQSGVYEETYEVEAFNDEYSASLERTIEFNTSYRIIESNFKKQIIRNSYVTDWEETILIDGTEYELNADRSTFSKSSAEDLTPGVSYYDTVISYNAKYITSDDEEINISVNGNIYGYNQPWSKVESQDLTMEISSDDGESLDMVIKFKPYLEAKKTIYYDKTSPYPISFGGTYNQIFERQSSLTYNVITTNHKLKSSQKYGVETINTVNEVEKLPIPNNLEFVEGHWAEDDIKKLYSMEILTEIPHDGIQYEAMPRGEFIKALCLAMDIDVSKYENIKNPVTVFGDVPPEHPLYKYIMAAYDAKLIEGVGQNFNVAVPISRQEAFVVYVRVIGLERLGVTENPITPFVDDGSIASWARQEIMAGYKLGIIKGNAQGEVQPTQWISKAEASAIINRLIDYLREEISIDYKY